MRSYRKPLQDLWFCEFEERLIGVNTVKVYGRPEKHRLTVSATSGFIRSWGAGLSLDYDRYITNFDRKFKPKEGMMVFVDIKPVLDGDGNLEAFIEYQKDADGNLVIDEDGDNVMLSIKYETSPDYMIKNILDTQKGHVARYGIKKV